MYFFSSLGQRRYFSLMRICTGIIGNSSSGILEMPYFNKITLNLGDRQKGRIFAQSIINSPVSLNRITYFLKKIEKNSFKFNNTKLPYGKSGAIKKIISILKKIKKKDIFYKKFRDLWEKTLLELLLKMNKQISLNYMQIKGFQKYLLKSDKNLLDAIKKLQINKYKTLIVVDRNKKLLGTVTDGDIRRALLRGYNKESKIKYILNKRPKKIEHKKKNSIPKK